MRSPISARVEFLPPAAPARHQQQSPLDDGPRDAELHLSTFNGPARAPRIGKGRADGKGPQDKVAPEPLPGWLAPTVATLLHPETNPAGLLFPSQILVGFAWIACPSTMASAH